MQPVSGFRQQRSKTAIGGLEAKSKGTPMVALPYDIFGVEFFPAFFVIARLLQFGQPSELISIIHFF